MEINPEVRARIIDAAERLYAEANREQLPTVDQVRRAARADMNTTSIVMREWRRAQTATPTSVAVDVPERVQEVMRGIVATVWREAQDLANESLNAAKQAWEIERAEADTLRAELAEAYEQQVQELEACRQQQAAAREEIDRLTAELEQMRERVAEAREHAARLAGQLQAHQEQAAALLARINPDPAESKPAGTRKKGGE